MKIPSFETLDLAPQHARWLLDSFGDWLSSPYRTRGGDQAREMFEQRYVHRMSISSVARVHGVSVSRTYEVVARSRDELMGAASAHLVAHDVRVLAEQISKTYMVPMRPKRSLGIKRASR